MTASVVVAAWAVDRWYTPSPHPEPVPAELLGVWRTDAPLYADRRFALRPDSVFFQTGPESASFTGHRIVGLERSETPQGQAYRIDYLEGSGAPITFRFSYRPGDSPEIVFSAQKALVWRREQGRGQSPKP